MTRGIGWPVEMWTGIIIEASLLGLVLALLMSPSAPGRAAAGGTGERTASAMCGQLATTTDERNHHLSSRSHPCNSH
ncbi:MAG: hypothetical protein ACR2MA_00105 [Egibacteraceae bacterium]